MNIKERAVRDSIYKVEQYIIDPEELAPNEDNHDYHQYKYNGLFNITSVIGGPIFVSKNMFKDVENRISNKVRFFNENGKETEPRQKIDDIFFEIEFFSRACTLNNVNLQINLRVEENELFNFGHDEDTLYPIANLYVLQRTEDNQIPIKFKDLYQAYSILENYFIYIIVSLLLLLLIGGVCGYVLYIYGKEDIVKIEEIFDENGSLL